MEQGIYRGTTPSITLNVAGVDLSNASVWPIVIVTVGNLLTKFDIGREKLDISGTDGGCSVVARMTQEQTLQMRAKSPMCVQIRAKDADGNAIASPMASVDVADVIKEGEI